VRDPEPEARVSAALPAGSASRQAPAEGRRPTGRSVGIGAGWTFPADLTIPGTVSVRFRFASGITIEPSVVAAIDGATDSVSFGTAETEDVTSALNLDLAAAVRAPVVGRGPVDLVLIGGGGIGLRSEEEDPEGVDNSIDRDALVLSLFWGLGLEWFVRPHWSVSFSATNPAATFTSSSTHTSSSESTSREYLFGAIFSPTVRLMVHMYL
jgi:hypothetical protein